jgi:Arm DNA-binding domain
MTLPASVFGCAGGGRTWVYQYKLGDKHRRITLGSATAIDVATARAQAVTLYAQVKLGQDPAGKKAEGRERAMQTFGAIVNSFLRAQQKRLGLAATSTRSGTCSTTSSYSTAFLLALSIAKRLPSV